MDVWKHREKVAVCETRGEASGDTSRVDGRVLASSLQNGKMMSFCCLHHLVSGILLRQPQEANTGPKVLCFFPPLSSLEISDFWAFHRLLALLPEGRELLESRGNWM